MLLWKRGTLAKVTLGQLLPFITLAKVIIGKIMTHSYIMYYTVNRNKYTHLFPLKVKQLFLSNQTLHHSCNRQNKLGIKRGKGQKVSTSNVRRYPER